MAKTQKTRIVDLPDGTVVQYNDGTHITRGIVCRPKHLDSPVVFTPSGYAGLTGDDRFWSVVPDASQVYRSEAIQAAQVFGCRYA